MKEIDKEDTEFKLPYLQTVVSLVLSLARPSKISSCENNNIQKK